MDTSQEDKIRKAVLVIGDVCKQQFHGQQRVQILISQLILLLDESFGSEHSTEIIKTLTDNPDLGFQPRALVVFLNIALIFKRCVTKQTKFSFNLIRCLYKETKRPTHSINPSDVSIEKFYSFISSPDYRRRDYSLEKSEIVSKMNLTGASICSIKDRNKGISEA